MTRFTIIAALLLASAAHAQTVPMPAPDCANSHACRAAWLARYCHESTPAYPGAPDDKGLQCPGAPKGWRYHLWREHF